MKIKFPSAQTILFIIAALVALMTWFVPAGHYDKLMYDNDANEFVRTSQESSEKLPATQATLETLNINVPLEKFTSGSIYKPIAIPNTYQKIESKPQGFVDFLKSPIRGINESADIIFLVLIIGGMIGVMNATGAFEAGIDALTKTLDGKEFLLIILVTSLIALGGTSFGLAEETMAFYPILIPVFLRARYDAMVALACIFLGSAIGTMYSVTNPFSVIIASDAAGINWTTGQIGRIFMLLGGLVISILYIMRYAKRVQNDPSRSILVAENDRIAKMFLSESAGDVKLNGRLRLILIVFALSFVVMVYGVVKLDWWFVEMTTVFLVASILIGVIGGVKEERFLEDFMNGASDLLGVAFIIGIARAVSILMEDGNISDTMLYYASGATEGMNKGLFINVLLFIYSGLSFFIPSSSGMAVLTMPIMSPLAETVGIGREHIVNAYQYGPGLFFIINPTGLILASLAMIKVGYDKWLKFIIPLLLILVAFTVISMTVMVYM